jgi:nitrite reductase/ring-hydroxylating ferredoxin subunit
MALVKVGSREKLPPGSLVEVLDGDSVVAVCNYNGEFHAVDGNCPHRGGRLGQGALHGNMIVCPWHAWEYDCVTGCNDYDNNVVLKKFAVTEQDGDIWVDVPQVSA